MGFLGKVWLPLFKYGFYFINVVRIWHVWVLLDKCGFYWLRLCFVRLGNIVMISVGFALLDGLIFWVVRDLQASVGYCGTNA